MDPGASRRSGRGRKADKATDDLPQLLASGAPAQYDRNVIPFVALATRLLRRSEYVNH